MSAPNSVFVTNNSSQTEWLANGSAGNVLTANSGAPPTWQAVPSGGITSITIQKFSTTGTYTPTVGMLYCIIELVGGGGGGGGCVSGGFGTAAAGSGGGAGGYARQVFSASSIGASQSVTIGAGGTAGSNAGGNGGTGGTTSVGALISATGGNGGLGQATAVEGIALNGATGGVGTGTLSLTGESGGIAQGVNVPTIGLCAVSGFGGNTVFGPGGEGQCNFSGGSVAGVNGANGGGGGGSYSNGTGSGEAGGVGGAGFVVITEYV